MRNTACILAMAVLLGASPVLSQPVVFDVSTNYQSDWLYFGHPAELRFYVVPRPHEVFTVCFALKLEYTNGMSLGTLQEGVNLFFSPEAHQTFASLSFWQSPGGDSLLLGGVSFGGPWGPWEPDDLFATIRFTPQDTGTIIVDTLMIPPANSTAAYDELGSSLPIDWGSADIVVLPCDHMVGDLNGSGAITLADIILLVNYVFKMGPPPEPVYIGDIYCQSSVTSADIVYLVNHQGKGGPPPPCVCFNPAD